MTLPDWPRAHGEPLFSAAIRVSSADFDVTEELDFLPSGDGEHDFLYVQKIDTNTEWLARQLAEFAGVAAKDLGYSGLKDRRAVTRQWFTVPRWNSPDWNAFSLENIEILEVARNNKKLRRGAHVRNRFRIVARGAINDREAVETRLAQIRERGVPNYFGEQRFGRQGGNLALASEWAAGKRLQRHKRSLAISTARSYMFNESLAKSVSDECWDQLAVGDRANLDGSGSVFTVELMDAEMTERLIKSDIHPTHEMPGEDANADDWPEQHADWLKALTDARVRPALRATRMRLIDLEWTLEDDALTLNFALARGCFATSALREILTTVG